MSRLYLIVSETINLAITAAWPLEMPRLLTILPLFRSHAPRVSTMKPSTYDMNPVLLQLVFNSCIVMEFILSCRLQSTLLRSTTISSCGTTYWRCPHRHLTNCLLRTQIGGHFRFWWYHAYLLLHHTLQVVLRSWCFGLCTSKAWMLERPSRFLPGRLAASGWHNLGKPANI